jgi:Tfp pilus assembly protein FimV
MTDEAEMLRTISRLACASAAGFLFLSAASLSSAQAQGVKLNFDGPLGNFHAFPDAAGGTSGNSAKTGSKAKPKAAQGQNAAAKRARAQAAMRAKAKAQAQAQAEARAKAAAQSKSQAAETTPSRHSPPVPSVAARAAIAAPAAALASEASENGTPVTTSSVDRAPLATEDGAQSGQTRVCRRYSPAAATMIEVPCE